MKNKKFIRPNQSAPVKILTSFAMAGEKLLVGRKFQTNSGNRDEKLTPIESPKRLSTSCKLNNTL
jgi:hypothetical protein